MSAGLPDPPADARAASQELAQVVRGAIEAAGGWIGFDRYMQLALYEPRLGYYAGASRKFGAEGDFVTAPEISPLFGRCVAAQCAQWLGQGAGEVVEFGAGSGALAAQVLAALHASDSAPARYSIVELSGELRQRQRMALAEHVPELLERVHWLDVLPDRIDGVVVANEVLDAMPVRQFRWQQGEVYERGVGTSRDGAALAWVDRPAEPAFAERVRTRLLEAWGDEAPKHYVSEISEQAEAWVETVGARLGQGAMLLIDYGFPRREFFHPQRAAGTLQCHFRHRVHADPFVWPGLQDITSHVEFTAIREAASRAGLGLLGYASQARFLIDCGLLEFFSLVPRTDLRAWTRQAQAVQQLLSEAEMGELFKAIAFGRGVPDDALGFSAGDRRRVLQ